jgi:hypothetical protein
MQLFGGRAFQTERRISARPPGGDELSMFKEQQVIVPAREMEDMLVSSSEMRAGAFLVGRPLEGLWAVL